MAETSDKLVLVGNRCIKNHNLRKSAQAFSSQYELCYSDTGIEYAGACNDSYYVVMVYDDFTDDIFSKLNSRQCYIISPHVLLSAANSSPVILPRKKRPLYNSSLRDTVICFTGFNERDEISELALLVHYMNGTIRKEFSPNVTHLIAKHCKGEKYKKAVSLGRPIMQHDWIHQLWSKRDDSSVTANSLSMMQFKAPPFLRCGIAFHGFTEEDLRSMEEMAMSNGGQLSQITESACTHLVVDDVQTLPDSSEIRQTISIVKAEWFWASIQMQACADEMLHSVQMEGRENTPSVHTATKSRHSLSRSKKRKRILRENLAALASEGESVTPVSLSSTNTACKSRLSAADQLSFLSATADITPDSSGCLLDTPIRRPRPSYLRAQERGSNRLPRRLIEKSDSPSPGVAAKKLKSLSPEKSQAKPSARKLVVSELLQTEANYCGILTNILAIFRDGAEKADQPGGPILSAPDAKIIFGEIPPILDVHKEIRADLEDLLQNWNDDLPVASIFLTKAEKLRQTYPPFVNYMEKTKEKISECMKNNNRFHAFMKVCERRTECGRQSLADLMMSIVQRLPRVELLLQQIHKYTDKKSADYRNLELAQSQLKDVMTHINEDKRITNERMVLFEIMNDIDNCPPNLLSASRNLVKRVDVDEVTDELVGRGEHLTLFIFTDSVEIVKRRHKASLTPFKSPASGRSASQSSHRGKPFKHVEFLTLPSIKRIIDITSSEDATVSEQPTPIFSLLCRKVTDSREKLYTFQLPDLDSVDKQELITTLARNVANSVCRTDYETLMACRPAIDFMITPLELNANNKTMTRAVNKFGKRLSRAMTIKSVPSPLKRAVSTMLTPTRRSSVRRNDHSSMSSTSSMWDLDQGESPRLANSSESPTFKSYATLPRNTALPRNTSNLSTMSEAVSTSSSSNKFKVSTMRTKQT